MAEKRSSPRRQKAPAKRTPTKKAPSQKKVRAKRAPVKSRTRLQVRRPTGKAVTRKAAPERKSTRSRTSVRKTTRSRSSRSSDPGLLTQLLTRRISRDRQLDLLGLLLLAVAIVTLLSLLSPRQGELTKTWIDLLGQALGWGMVAAPLAMAAIGLWLILRHFGERRPALPPHRLLGLVLGYLAFLTTAHFAGTALSNPDPQALAAAAQGGGYLGSAMLTLLTSAVGQIGGAIVIAVWWLVALVLTTETTLGAMAQRLNRPVPPAPASPARADGSTLAVKTAPTASGRGRKPPQVIGPSPATPAAIAGMAILPGLEPQVVIGESATAPEELPAIPQEEWEDLPKIEDILDPGSGGSVSEPEIRRRSRTIQDTLASFGVPVTIEEVNSGPSVTQFGVKPELINKRRRKTRAQLLAEAEEVLAEEIVQGAMATPATDEDRAVRLDDIARNLDAYEVIQTKVKVAKIVSLADDLALALAAPTIRIEAPVPGKNFVGIEVPNGETNIVSLRDVVESPAFQRLRSPLRIALGQNVAGQAVAADLARMPHLLIAGTTGSGKSVCVNSIICCLMLQNTPEHLKLIMVDPKRVELTGYNGTPHLLGPVVVDVERVVPTLQGVTKEMDGRYKLFARLGARNLEDYNVRALAAGEPKLPYLVVIVDELADLMMQAPEETERTLIRLAQMARATGIHLVIATQRPSVDVVTGVIKANFPARIAFAVASSIDSRVILDTVGAERLLGRGDMLFISPESGTPMRLQGCFVSDDEIHRLVRYWKDKRTSSISPFAARAHELEAPAVQVPLWQEISPPQPASNGSGAEDELLPEAEKIVRELNKASVSLLQRRLRIGYTRAARLIDLLEERGVVGPAQSGSLPRDVLPPQPEPPASRSSPDPPTES